jgi:hypothetical protein
MTPVNMSDSAMTPCREASLVFDFDADDLRLGTHFTYLNDFLTARPMSGSIR